VTPGPLSDGGQARPAADLVGNLRAAGLTVEHVDSIQQPFFTPRAEVYTVNGDDLQVFQYPTQASADNEASRVSANGAIGGSMPMWIAPPHFFHKDRLIVIYLGSNGAVIAALTRDLGPQFAR
jgi:hypothetical protein